MILRISERSLEIFCYHGTKSPPRIGRSRSLSGGLRVGRS